MVQIYDGTINNSHRQVRVLAPEGNARFTQIEVFSLLNAARKGHGIFDPKVEGPLSCKDYHETDWKEGRYPSSVYDIDQLRLLEFVFYSKGLENDPKPKISSKIVYFENEFDRKKLVCSMTGRIIVVSFDVPDVPVVVKSRTRTGWRRNTVRLPEARGIGIIPISKLELIGPSELGRASCYQIVPTADFTPQDVKVKIPPTAWGERVSRDEDGFATRGRDTIFSNPDSLSFIYLNSGVFPVIPELQALGVELTGYLGSIGIGFVGIGPVGDVVESNRLLSAGMSWSARCGLALAQR